MFEGGNQRELLKRCTLAELTGTQRGGPGKVRRERGWQPRSFLGAGFEVEKRLARALRRKPKR